MNGIADVGASSSVVWSGTLEMMGGSFTELTDSRKLALAAPPSPSLTVRVIVAEPNWLVAGLRVTVRFDPLPPKRIFASGTRSGLDERPLTIKLSTGVSTSPMENGMAAVGECSIARLYSSQRWMGESFTGLTDSRKLALAAPPSPTLTVRVIALHDALPISGLRVTVRFDPLPPKRIFASGTRSGLDERPLTIKLSGGVSTSPMENGMAAV